TDLGGAEGSAIALSPVDLTEEPDTLRDPAAIRDLMDRLDRIHAWLAAGPVTLTMLPAGATATPQEVTLTAAPRRPAGDLPGAFWMQIGVGLVGMVLCGWVIALRRGDRA